MEAVDSSAMRRINVSATLSALQRRDSVTMAQLTNLSGLSRRTLDLILESLIEEGWVIDTPPVEGRSRPVGRPARTFAFNYGAACVVAIQLDIDDIAVVVADLKGTIRGEHSVRTPRREALGRAARLAAMYECVDAALTAAGDSLDSIIAVTMSTPGIVRDDGTVDLPLSIPEWAGFSLEQELRDHFHCSVYVENDAKLAAIGENWAGTGRSTRNFVWIRADGIRTGLGIVINGELYRGNQGAAGEIVWADNLGFNTVREHVLSGLTEPTHPLYEDSTRMINHARSGDPYAKSSVQRLADALAPGLVSLAWVLAPEQIVIGGTLGEISDLMIPALKESLARFERPIEAAIVGSELGPRAMLLGGLKKCLDQVHQQLFSTDELPRLPHYRVA